MASELVVFLIPLIAAVVGWGTNVLAVEMMFYPLRFVGIPPWFGWQGIIPANSVALASRSTHIITTKLLNLRVLFRDFHPASFVAKLEVPIRDISDRIVADTATALGSPIWSALSEEMKGQLRGIVQAEVKAVTERILAELGDNIEEVLDLKAIVVAEAERNPGLIGRMFQSVGVAEFRFIRRSGAYFGFLFGVIQLAVWLLYPAWWVLPFFGFLVGHVTNWLAIKLIFAPAEPRRVGPFVLHGLFHKRQEEVAREFAAIVSREILNPKNMVKSMVSGAMGERLFGIVDRHVGAMLDRFRDHPAAKTMAPEERWPALRANLLGRVRGDLAKTGGFLDLFVRESVNIYGELFERMTKLDSTSFEGVLRPAFQKDEWKLILAGALLGLAAGVLQVVYLFGDRLVGR